MLKINDFAPNFTLKNEANEDITLSSFRGQKVILYFYPKDFTSGCTLQAQSFAKHHDAFKELGYKVIGISKDTVSSHHRFKLKENLNFMLLADPSREVLETYEVVKEKMMYGKKVKGTRRSIFILDEEGLISDIFHDVNVNTFSEELLNHLRLKK